MEEFDSGPRSIEGVSTSTVGFLGYTERGPLQPKLITNLAQFTQVYGGFIENSFLTYAVDGFFTNGGKRCFIGRVASESETQTFTVKDASGESLFILTSVGPGTWANRISVTIDKASDVENPNLFKLTLRYYSTEEAKNEISKHNLDVKPDEEEIFDNISFDKNSPRFLESIVNGISFLVTAYVNDTNIPKNIPKKLSNQFMIDVPSQSELRKDDENNNDNNLQTVNSESVELNSFKGYTILKKNPFDNSIIEEFSTGLLSLSKINDISIICVPDEVNIIGLQDAIIDHCETMKDRFAILQSRYDDNIPEKFGSITNNLDSKFAAIYIPWVKIIDPVSGLPKLIPPGGHVAGIYARSDVNRGVHKAPANEVLRGVNGLQIAIDEKQQSILNPKGVNVIRSFPGRGILVWGARTVSSNPDRKYINMIRLIIFITKSLARATQWVVFEPNNSKLWAAVTATITQFLYGVWRNGALMGTTDEESFFVKCDSSTMTEDDIQNGRLVCEIGLAIIKPAEFVIFRLVQTRSGFDYVMLD